MRSAEPEARRAEDEDDDDPAERRGEPPRASARPDKADESLETYIYRRIDPEHFAALDRERQIIFEEKKRKQISDRARRADALPYTPLFAADDPRSWTQETQRTDAPLSSSDD